MLKRAIVTYSICLRKAVICVSQFLVIYILYMKVQYRQNIEYTPCKYVMLLLLFNKLR